MKLNKNQLQFIINCDVEGIVKYLQEDYGYSIIDAFDKVYNSEVYQKLLNIRTGLYLESPRYIYSYLQEEIPRRKATHVAEPAKLHVKHIPA